MSFLPAQITIIRMVNDWEFKFCFFISNHYAKIREINKLLVVCRERTVYKWKKVIVAQSCLTVQPHGL